MHTLTTAFQQVLAAQQGPVGVEGSPCHRPNPAEGHPAAHVALTSPAAAVPGEGPSGRTAARRRLRTTARLPRRRGRAAAEGARRGSLPSGERVLAVAVPGQPCPPPAQAPSAFPGAISNAGDTPRLQGHLSTLNSGPHPRGVSQRPAQLPADPVVSRPELAGPGACTFDSRHLYTKKVCGEGSIRAVSYNILADTYAQTEFSRTVLYPYCAPYALELDYRQNLLKKELAGYSADLICLQEVDKSVFVDSLAPALDAFGLEGLFKIKEKQHEGLATFYRRDKFSLLSQHDIAFSEVLLSDPLHKELCDKLAKYPLVQEKVLQRSSVLQVSVLQSATDPSRKICVANTHLYWHPKGGNIRLIQTAVALSHIKHVACDLYPSIPIIFCGDFNSIPSSGTYSFISSGVIAEDHEDWVSNGEEERCNMPLSHPFKLLSACGEPAYTNYVGGFHGCLDYIFIDKNALEVEQVIPLPSHEEVTTHQALPSVSHPSDHIALVCDLKWK
ncbi:PREDICTED: 2',5'-phosphodiesterase 12 [Charadrius vociferus]|uniref:2',5'-phosphodiesterase 12 n=1 Tax=Charadrius vociferus TaxID=50402 RepID=UPI000521B60B|nr:PREDICTED: 2',5'-phosphodiesterase 12 [Charadrius vociferus]